MAAVPFFILSSTDAGRYCTDQLNERPASAKTEPPRVDRDLPGLLGLRDAAAAARRTVDNHVDMIAADRDAVCPPIDLQHLPAVYRSPTAATMDARTSSYAGHDDYYRTVTDFASYSQYPSSLITRPHGNGYCRSVYADKCAARRYPIESESYFHPGSVQPAAWARLPVGGAFPFPVAAHEFGGGSSNGGGPREYQQGAVAPSGDCCRTDLVSERPSFCGQTPVDAGQRRRQAVSDRSPPPPLRTSGTTANSCCRLDSADGGTEQRDRLVATSGDELNTITSSKSTTTSSTSTTTSSSTPVVVYPWMRKLHGRSSSGNGQSAFVSVAHNL